jgi:hypothetical protein
VLLALASAPAAGLELAPSPGVGAHAAGLRLELDDAGHALEEGAVVGDDDETATVPVERALEERQAREVEVVGRLVEEKHVSAGSEHRLEPAARRLAAGAPLVSPLLLEEGDRQIGRPAPDGPGVGRLDSCQHPQERRLADAVRPDDADAAPRRHHQRDAIEHDELAERLAHRAGVEDALLPGHALSHLLGRKDEKRLAGQRVRIERGSRPAGRIGDLVAGREAGPRALAQEAHDPLGDPSRANRSGCSTARRSPIGPPQSWTTTVTARRSSSSTSRRTDSTWKS